MGGGHSKPHVSAPHCDYSGRDNTINTLRNKLKTEIDTNSSVMDQNKKLKKEQSVNKTKIDTLSTICLVSDTNKNLSKKDLVITGKKIYKLLSNNYKENLKILELQQNLLVFKSKNKNNNNNDNKK